MCVCVCLCSWTFSCVLAPRPIFMNETGGDGQNMSRRRCHITIENSASAFAEPEVFGSLPGTHVSSTFHICVRYLLRSAFHVSVFAGNSAAVGVRRLPGRFDLNSCVETNEKKTLRVRGTRVSDFCFVLSTKFSTRNRQVERPGLRDALTVITRLFLISFFFFLNVSRAF